MFSGGYYWSEHPEKRKYILQSVFPFQPLSKKKAIHLPFELQLQQSLPMVQISKPQYRYVCKAIRLDVNSGRKGFWSFRGSSKIYLQISKENPPASAPPQFFGGRLKPNLKTLPKKKGGGRKTLAFRQDVGKIHQTLGNLPTIQGIEVFLMLKNKSGGGWNGNQDGCWTIVESMPGLFVFFWKWGIGCWGSFQAIGNGRRKCQKKHGNKAKKRQEKSLVGGFIRSQLETKTMLEEKTYHQHLHEESRSSKHSLNPTGSHLQRR